MPAYISLVNFTEQGVRDAKNSINRVRTFEKALEAAGGRKIAIWWTLGQYDLVVITEMPDDQTAARVLLQTAMLGNVRTTTLRGFSEDEMESIVQGLA